MAAENRDKIYWSYGPSGMAFYRKNRVSLTYGTDQASDVNKISIIWYSIFRETEARIHEQTHFTLRCQRQFKHDEFHAANSPTAFQ